MTITTTITDRLADLATGVDHDLRGRLRTLQREAEAWVADNDPGTGWHELEQWLDERAGRDVRAVTDAVRADAARLARDAGVALRIDLCPPAVPSAIGCHEPRPARAADAVLTVVRGGCSGVITAGLLGSLAGMAVAAPASVAVGSAFAVKSWRDERSRQVVARRAEARVAVQRHLDEIAFQVGAETRRLVRDVHRAFRDAASASRVSSVTPAAPVAVDADTVSVAPVRATVLHPPVAVRRPRRSWAWPALMAATLVAIATVGGLALLPSVTRAASASSSSSSSTPAAVAGAAAAPASAPADVPRFVSTMVAATRDADVAVLVDSLHTAVIGRYGMEQCRRYLSAAGAFALDLVVRDVARPAPWVWRTDGRSGVVDGVVGVEVSRVVNGDTIVQEIHVAVERGAVRWFTDCGEPVSA